MGKLIDKFIEWALQEKRWPLLLPLSIPALFEGVRAYYSLSFRDTAWNWHFFVPTFIVLSTSVALYLKLRKSPALPHDRLVVGIAQFRAISEEAVDEAKNVRDHIEQKLLALQEKGAPLETKLLSSSVEGDTPVLRQDNAILLGTSASGSAHVVLWGDVRKSDGELMVRPRLTVARQFRDIRIEEKRLREFTSDEPKHLDFKERVAEEIADIVILIYGLAYYKIDDWSKAIEVLSQAHTNEAYLYKAQAFLERALQAAQPRQDLDAALETYQKVVESLNDTLHLTDDVTWRAYLGIANVFKVGGMMRKDPGPVREAVVMYRNALENHPPAETRSPKDWTNSRTVIQLNLGIALRLLGNEAQGKEGLELLREAASTFKAVRTDYKNVPIAALVISENHLGETLRELATRVKGSEEAVEYLREAMELFAKMLPVLANYKYLNKLGAEIAPEVLGRAQTSSGLVLYDLGTRVAGPEGKGYLKSAVDRFNSALSIFDSTNHPERHAEILAHRKMAQQNLDQP